jgi:hypothetical protein
MRQRRSSNVATFFGILVVLHGCALSPQREEPAASTEQMPPGFAGVSMVMLSLQSGQYILSDDSARALDALDAQLVQGLSLMVSAEPFLRQDESFSKARNRLIPTLKDRWLKRPPAVLDPYLESYIQEVCSLIRTCPDGEIRQKSQGEQFDPK